MKSLFLILLTFISFHTFPGDKGNMVIEITDLNATSLEHLMNMGLEVEEKLYGSLERKEFEVLDQKEVISEYVSLINELMNRGDEFLLSSLVTNNDRFYSAFSGMEEVIFKDFIEEVTSALKTKQSASKVDTLFNKINYERLNLRSSKK